MFVQFIPILLRYNNYKILTIKPKIHIILPKEVITKNFKSTTPLFSNFLTFPSVLYGFQSSLALTTLIALQCPIIKVVVYYRCIVPINHRMVFLTNLLLNYQHN